MTVAQRVLPYKASDPDGTWDSRYYTKPEVDALTADTGEHTHDDLYDRSTEVDAKIAAATYDDRYYTETEINAKLAGPLVPSSVATTGIVQIGTDLIHKGTKAGFFNATPVTKPSVSGGRRGNPALASLLTALASLGIVSNSTTEDMPVAFEGESDDATFITISGTSTHFRGSVDLGPLASGRMYLVELEGLALGEGAGVVSDAQIVLELAGIETYTSGTMRWEAGVDGTRNVTNKVIVTGTGATVTAKLHVKWVSGSYSIKFTRITASATPIG